MQSFFFVEATVIFWMGFGGDTMGLSWDLDSQVVFGMSREKLLGTIKTSEDGTRGCMKLKNIEVRQHLLPLGLRE